jgi:hypothetical protein
MTCVATGSAYVVPAVVGLRLQAGRIRRRRSVRPASTAQATELPAAGPPRTS